jgi:hypothetical protein
MDTTFTKKYVKQIDLKSWPEFKLKIDSFKLEWIYRGQSNALWELASSLERHSSLLDIIGVEDVEMELIDEYRKAIRSFLDFKGTPKTTLEWLSLLHHGTPTRLIDFTESPYIAAYFAFQDDESEMSESVAIWCVNRIRFYQAALYYLKEQIEITTDCKHYLFTESAFEKLFNHADIDCIIPFDLANANQRQFIQQSVFVCNESSEKVCRPIVVP